MEKFFRDLANRAATIDELLGSGFEIAPADKSTTELAASRLAAWCRSSANGDWVQFGRRLAIQGWQYEQILSRFSAALPTPSIAAPAWLSDAIWIEREMCSPAAAFLYQSGTQEAYPFIELTLPTVERANSIVWAGVSLGHPELTSSAHDSLRDMLLTDLSELCSAAFYERFKTYRSSRGAKVVDEGSRGTYLQFIGEMKRSGLRDLFEEKPVLLRLIAVLTRQWIDTTRELKGRAG